MKRYALFAGSTFYPKGGWKDFIRSAYTIEELTLTVEEVEECLYDWSCIVDLDREMIIQSRKYHFGTEPRKEVEQTN